MTIDATADNEVLGSRATRRSLPAAVADHIRRLVFTGVLRPGDRVPIDEIAADLEVSRLPVREAVATMARDGLLDVRPHRGAYVGDFDERFLREHFEIVGLVQALAAVGVLHADAGPRAIDRLAALSTEADATESPVEVHRRVTDSLTLLHEVGGSAAQNAVLSAVGQLLPTGWFARLPGAADAGRRGLARMVDALRSGNPEHVREACLRNQQERCEVVLTQLRATGVLATRR